MSQDQPGFLVFGRNGSPISRDNAYDSRKPRLQVSLVDKPPKLAILDDFVGGSALVSDPAVKQREVLFTTPHKLPYTPEVFLYLYTKTYGGSASDSKAGFYSGQAIFYSGSSGTIEDRVALEVDETEIRIVHTLEDFLYVGTYVSDAPKYILRLKYYILSNDSHVSSYDFEGNVL